MARAEGEFAVAANASGVRVLQGEIISFDPVDGLSFKYKRGRKTTRVVETIPSSCIVYLKGKQGEPKAEVAYNSSGFTIAEFDKVTDVKPVKGGMFKGTTKAGDPIHFNTQYASLSTLAATGRASAKKAKGEKKGKKADGKKPKAKMAKGKKLKKASF
jgi:hypothetical protein